MVLSSAAALIRLPLDSVKCSLTKSNQSGLSLSQLCGSGIFSLFDASE
jgi:hypothetical protein